MYHGEYDRVKCPVCGFPWTEHLASCPRHAYRPRTDETSLPEAIQQSSQVVIVAADWRADEYARTAKGEE